MSRNSLSVVIPCYNEEKNIPLLVQRFFASNDCELILVENGSRDDSLRVMKRLQKRYPRLKIVRIPTNLGYGHGIYQGLIKAKGECLCWTHADLQTDPKDIDSARRIFEKEKDPRTCFVKGTRKNRPILDTFLTICMSMFETAYLRTPLWDINAQPNVFHHSFLKRLTSPPKDFSFDLYAYYIAKRAGYSVRRFSVEFGKRIHGKSSWNTSIKQKMKFIHRTLRFSRELKQTLKQDR
jgi:polyisoprenyl-phosphate glycosyltransferase